MFGMTGTKKPITAEIDELWYVALTDHIIDLQWSPCGKLLAAATVEGAIAVIEDRGNEAFFYQVGQHQRGANAVAWSRDGQRLASSGQDGVVQLWTRDQWHQPERLSNHESWVSRVAFSSRRDVMAWAAGKVLRVANLTGEVFYESDQHDSTIAEFAWSPDGKSVGVVAYNGVTVHAPGQTAEPRKYAWKGSSLSLAWSPDAKYIATGEQDSTVHFWHVKSGKDARMAGFPTKVLELSWHHSSRWLITSGGSALVLWDCSGAGPAGRKPKVWENHPGKVSQVAFQPRGDFLLSVDQTGVLILWHLKHEDDAISGRKLSAGANCLRWSPDGTRFAVGQNDGTVVLFQLNAKAGA
jgi:WD40 repeat protein